MIFFIAFRFILWIVVNYLSFLNSPNLVISEKYMVLLGTAVCWVAYCSRTGSHQSSLAAVKSVSSPVSLRRLRMTCRVLLMNCLYIEQSFTLLSSDNCKHIYARRMNPGRWTQDDDSLQTLYIYKVYMKKWHTDLQGVSLLE